MHDVKALVALREPLQKCAEHFSAAVVCPLPQDFALLPITEALACELKAIARSTPELLGMAPGVSELASQVSDLTPVTYMSTDYFGGEGGQDAILWERGQITRRFLDSELGSNWPNTPISQCLRAMGVRGGEGQDEFDALGLGNHRRTEGWANAHCSHKSEEF